MVARNNSRVRLCAPLEPSSARLAQQIQTFFAAHPQLSRETFLLSALQRELAFRNWNEDSDIEGIIGAPPRTSSGLSVSLPSQTESDLRFRALLAARVAALHRPKYGRWRTIRKVLANPFFRFVQACRRMK